MVFSSNNIASKMSDEWQVGDRVESLTQDDSWAAANIIAISDDYKYSLLFESGVVSLFLTSLACFQLVSKGIMLHRLRLPLEVP